MKKLKSMQVACLLLCLIVSFIENGKNFGASPPTSVSINESGQANYSIARYVMGSGGVIGARSDNYVQHGTAGQAFVGVATNAKNLHKSGFWIVPTLPTAVAPTEEGSLPTAFALHQNYPNPFNPETTIAYDLPCACLVVVEIFNSVGQRIRLVSSELQGPGQITMIWDGCDDQGHSLASGVFLYRITSFSAQDDRAQNEIQFRDSKKMLLVR